MSERGVDMTYSKISDTVVSLLPGKKWIRLSGWL